MSPVKEPDLSKLILSTLTSRVDYEDLCRFDVLGFKDPSAGEQEQVYIEFKEQLQRSPEGWYQTGIHPGNHLQLPSNQEGSMKRLNFLVKRFERSGMLERCNEVIKGQLEKRIVEHASGPELAKSSVYHVRRW